MKTALLVMCLATACMTDHAISGVATDSDGDCISIDVTATSGGSMLDHVEATCGFGFYNDPEGSFVLHVPDGASDVALDFQAHSQADDDAEDNAHHTLPLSGRIDSDLDLGTFSIN
jgi:hypothetical protein